MLGGHSADDHGVAAVSNAFQLGNTAQIDKVLGHRQPELHHRDQALPASERACLFAILGEECGCLSERVRAVVGEWGRDHGHTSWCKASCPGKTDRGRATSQLPSKRLLRCSSRTGARAHEAKCLAPKRNSFWQFAMPRATAWVECSASWAQGGV